METLYTNKFLRTVSKPFMNLDKITATASPSPNRWSDKVPSREMTVEEIRQFIDAFAQSAKLLKDAGVDGVEVHEVNDFKIVVTIEAPSVDSSYERASSFIEVEGVTGVHLIYCNFEDEE